MKSWLQSQFASRSEERTPIAPLSIQGAAEHWEPSVQNFVGERGGLQIAELKSAVEQKWAFRFKINKVTGNFTVSLSNEPKMECHDIQGLCQRPLNVLLGHNQAASP